MKTIPLTQNRFSIVDDDDFEWLMKYSWCVQRSGRYSFHAKRGVWVPGGKQKTLLMHRAILERHDVLSSDQDVDHADGNGLNNQKSNLRVCTTSQNICNSRIRSDNSSGYKGVSFDKKRNKWQARIRVGRKYLYLGRFLYINQAITAYANAAKKYYGEFSRLR